MFRDAVALPAKCFVQGDTRASESRCSIRHTLFGRQGLPSSHLSLPNAVVAHLNQGRGKVLLVFRASEHFSKSYSTTHLTVVNQKRGASLGERVDLSVSCTRKEVQACESSTISRTLPWTIATHHHIFHYQRLSRPPLSLSLIPVYFHPMSSEIETPCRRIPSLVDCCRQGLPFYLHLGSLAFVNPRPLSRDCPCKG